MSGLEYLLDTNVVISLLKDKEFFEEVDLSRDTLVARCCVSQITRMELLSFPSITKDDEVQVARFLSAVRIILLDEQIEAVAIALRREKRLKLPDAVIAASARVFGLKLLTLDTRLRNAVGGPH